MGAYLSSPQKAKQGPEQDTLPTSSSNLDGGNKTEDEEHLHRKKRARITDEEHPSREEDEGRKPASDVDIVPHVDQTDFDGYRPPSDHDEEEEAECGDGGVDYMESSGGASMPIDRDSPIHHQQHQQPPTRDDKEVHISGDPHRDASSYLCRVCGEVVPALPSKQQLPPLPLDPRAMFPVAGAQESLLRALDLHCIARHLGYYDWNLAERLFESEVASLYRRGGASTEQQDDEVLAIVLLYLAARAVPHPEETTTAAWAAKTGGPTSSCLTALFESRFAVARSLCVQPYLLAVEWRDPPFLLPLYVAKAVQRLGTSRALERVRDWLEHYRSVALGLLGEEQRFTLERLDAQARVDVAQNAFLVPRYALWMSQAQRIPPPLYYRMSPGGGPLTASVAVTVPPAPPLLTFEEVYRCRFCRGVLGYTGVPVAMAALQALHPEIMYDDTPPSLLLQIELHELLVHPKWTSWNLEHVKCEQRREAMDLPMTTPEDVLFREALYGAGISVRHVVGDSYDNAELWLAAFDARFVAAKFLVGVGALFLPPMTPGLAPSIGPAKPHPRTTIAVLERLEAYHRLLRPLVSAASQSPAPPQQRIDILQSCFLCPPFIDWILTDGRLPSWPSPWGMSGIK